MIVVESDDIIPGVVGFEVLWLPYATDKWLLEATSKDSSGVERVWRTKESSFYE